MMLHMYTVIYCCCFSVQLNYRADYEKNKSQYTLSQDMPELKKAKANADLISDVSRRMSADTHTHTHPHPHTVKKNREYLSLSS